MLVFPASDILLQLVIMAVKRFKEGNLERRCSDAEASKRARSRPQTLTGSARLGLFPRKNSGHPRKDSGCARKDSRFLRNDSCCLQKVSGVPHKDSDFLEPDYEGKRSIEMDIDLPSEMEFEETCHDSSVDKV